MPRRQATERPSRTAVLYARVSTDPQERDGSSLDTQERACREYAERAGYEVVEAIRDSASGFTLDRPGWHRVRELLSRQTIGVVIAYAVDRLSRSQTKLGVLLDDIERAGASLEIVTEQFEDTAVGRFILSARAFSAEVEREKIVERTMRGKAEAARRGRIPQGSRYPLYGYLTDTTTKRRIVQPAQAAVVVEMFERFVASRSLGMVTRWLNESGIPAQAGGRWHVLTVRRILTNVAYTGTTYFHRLQSERRRDAASGRTKRIVSARDASEWIEVPDATPAIVSSALFSHAQEILADPARLKLGRPIADYPLTSHLECSVCGRGLTGHQVQRRWRYYRCTYLDRDRPDRCVDGPRVTADRLEATVIRAVQEVLAAPAVVLEEIRARNRGVASVDVNDITQQRERQERLRHRLNTQYRYGELDDAHYAAQLAAIKTKLADLDQQLAPSQALPEPTVEDLERRCAAIRRKLDQAGAPELRLVAQGLALRVVVSRSQVTVRGEIPAGLFTKLRTSGSLPVEEKPAPFERVAALV